MFKKIPHKNVDSQSADHVHKTRSPGVKGQRAVRVRASASSTRNSLFASLDQFGQINLNHSHSNELIRKYIVTFEPKVPSPVRVCAQGTVCVLAHACVQPLLPHCSSEVELCHQPRPVSGAAVLIHFAPGAANRAQSGCCVHIREWKIRPAGTKTTTKQAFPVGRQGRLGRTDRLFQDHLYRHSKK